MRKQLIKAVFSSYKEVLNLGCILVLTGKLKNFKVQAASQTN